MCTGIEIFQIAATAFQAVRSISQGQQAEEYHNFQAQQMQADAQAEREAGDVRARQVRKAGRGTQSEAVASLAASGVEVSAGTPVKIASTVVRNAEEDALNEILYGTRKGTRLDQQAALERQAGERAAAGGVMGAAASVLAGGSKLVGPGWKSATTKGGSYTYAGEGTVRIA